MNAFSVHAHALDPVCTATNARFLGQSETMKSNVYCAVTKQAKPASVSKPSLGVPDSQQFMCCQNRTAPWISCKCRSVCSPDDFVRLKQDVG